MTSTPTGAHVPVTVAGLNPRSAAVVRTLAEAGHPVTVWDPASDSELPGVDGTVHRAASPQAAVEASPLVIVMVDDYDAAQAFLDDVGSAVASRDVVNLTSGTTAQAQELAAWTAARRGRYLDGALMSHPEHVGRPETVLVFSGSTELFERHGSLLRRLGSANYLGPEAGTAALYDLAMLNFAWATLIGFLQTAALLGQGGVHAATVAPLLTRWLATTVTGVIIDYGAQIDKGDYPGDEEWLELDAPLMDHLVQATAERGLDTRLPELIRNLTHQGIDAGHGRDSFASLIDVIRSNGGGRP